MQVLILSSWEVRGRSWGYPKADAASMSHTPSLGSKDEGPQCPFGYLGTVALVLLPRWVGR